MERDELYEIFSLHLNKADPDRFSLESFSYEVTGTFISELMKKGNIPHQMLDILESDIREEVEFMFKKTTYGYLNFKEYKSAKSNRSKKNRA